MNREGMTLERTDTTWAKQHYAASHLCGYRGRRARWTLAEERAAPPWQVHRERGLAAPP